jgi:hypothetical protein
MKHHDHLTKVDVSVKSVCSAFCTVQASCNIWPRSLTRSAARALRFYRQAQFRESRICGEVPCGLHVPQGETCHARLLARTCRSEVQLLHRNKQKVEYAEATACGTWGSHSGVAADEVFQRHSVTSQKIWILNTCILELSKYYVLCGFGPSMALKSVYCGWKGIKPGLDGAWLVQWRDVTCSVNRSEQKRQSGYTTRRSSANGGPAALLG